jgi:hypothetical protein
VVPSSTSAANTDRDGVSVGDGMGAAAADVAAARAAAGSTWQA